MNRTMMILLSLILTSLLAVTANAQDFGPGQGNGVCQFIDEDGDGFNDLAPDADGDGIPNGLDEDFVKPEDGSGNMYQYLYKYNFGAMGEDAQHRFGNSTDGAQNGNHYGPGDGTGQGTGPADGSGFGPGTGDGTCDEDGTSEGSSVQQQRGNRR